MSIGTCCVLDHLPRRGPGPSYLRDVLSRCPRRDAPEQRQATRAPINGDATPDTRSQIKAASPTDIRCSRQILGGDAMVRKPPRHSVWNKILVKHGSGPCKFCDIATVGVAGPVAARPCPLGDQRFSRPRHAEGGERDAIRWEDFETLADQSNRTVGWQPTG